MKRLQSAFLAAILACAASAQAQILATQRAGFGLPAGQVAAPNTPGGAVVVGKNFYASDAVNGFRHYKPADPNNPDPINTGNLILDTDPSHSMGGTSLCIYFCHVGQVAYDGNQTVYVAAYDHAKGQKGSLTFPGIWRLFVDPISGDVTPGALLVPNAGLAGNLPTSVALGPDGNLYIGFLKNGNVVRIVNPTLDPTNKSQIVQSVGTAPNGSPVRSLAFVGTDLYVGTSTGLAVIKNAVASTSVMQSVATGGTNPNTGAIFTFAFVGGNSNLVMLDRLGNLWIGDDTSDGTANFSGRLSYISAGSLASIP